MTHDSKLSSPLVVIVGETASGKSELAMMLAQLFNGEIICADSRTIYKGMDIGTAKPSTSNQAKIRHHMLDLLTPEEKFNVRNFKKLAEESIENVTARGKLPVLTGGSGLYMDAVIYGFQFSPPGARRDLLNPRHLKYQELRDYKTMPSSSILMLGLRRPINELEKRIISRTASMIKSGLVSEVKTIVDRYGWESPGMNTIGYREFQAYFEGEKTLEETVADVIRNTLLYAKRQRTWFKRNESIHWLDDPSKAVDLVTTYLNKKR